MDQSNYHVLLDGRTVGPYDRRTIVGMRIKHMLTGDHLLLTGGGSQLTVRELIGAAPDAPVQPTRAGSSGVQATYTAMLLERGRGGHSIPGFKGEFEVRVQRDVLRLAGRYRSMFRWRDGRVKLPMTDVVFARSKGPRTDVWLQQGSCRLQRLGLYLFTAEAADELARWLAPPGSRPEHPAAAAAKAAAAGQPPMSSARVLAVAVLGLCAVLGLMLLVLLYRRVY